MTNNFNSFSPLTTDVKKNPNDAQRENYENLIHKQIEGYQNEIQQFNTTVENLTNEIKKIKEAHIIEITEKEAVSKTLKETQQENSRKDDVIKTLTETQNSKIEKLIIKMDEAVNIPARIQEMKEEIITSNDELKNDIQDIVDAVLRTKLDEFEVNIFTEVSKIVSNMQIPATTKYLSPIENDNAMSALENIKNGLFRVYKGQEGMTEIIKEHIDATPKTTTETPNLDAFYDKLIKKFDENIKEKLILFEDFYNEKIESLMKVKEASGQPQDKASGTIGKPSGQPQDKASGKSTEHSGTTSGKNEEKILNSLRIKKQSQKELVDGLDMNSGTVSGIIKSLINKGIVKNVEGIYEVIDGF